MNLKNKYNKLDAKVGIFIYMFHLYNMSSICKHIDRKQINGCLKWELITNENRGFAGEGVGNVLKQTVVMVTQLCKCTKKSSNCTLPMGEFQVCKFYFNQFFKK